VQRTTVVAAARKIRVEAGLQESIGDEHLAEIVDLPPPVMRLVREIALGSVNANREFCERIQTNWFTEGTYVEIVLFVSRIVDLDVFARGLSIPPRPLAAPAENGVPSFERPAEAVDEGFLRSPRCPPKARPRQRVPAKICSALKVF